MTRADAFGSPEGAAVSAQISSRITTLVLLASGHRLAAEADGSRARFTADDEARAVEVECLPRPDDAANLWFTLGGMWLCEATNPTDALITIKAALRSART
ncbi:hypothetical protein [Actinocorallia sp. A-T 12471]|uniref:hypothetical protein n=1 Tax=Actinocorallia sp. A-T 12471 TaxID=3089813 RepID=UPI0029CCDFDD|nr:hypothetical protein [Actinocorallia sp. A-T 12471]MDX6739335.1 hypothetical protein [Actinocorallia sp. A-T 12471]